MTYEFDTTVLDGLPVTIEFETTVHPDLDGDGNNEEVDEWSIVAVNGRTVSSDPLWILKRIGEKNEAGRILNECYENMQ